MASHLTEVGHYTSLTYQGRRRFSHSLHVAVVQSLHSGVQQPFQRRRRTRVVDRRVIDMQAPLEHHRHFRDAALMLEGESF